MNVLIMENLIKGFTMRKILILSLAFFAIISTSCSTMQSGDITGDSQDFINGDDLGKETFRVLLTSDAYQVKQFRYKGSIERTPDKGGDKYISHELKKLNMINEVRNGIITVWLYPDSGRIMKIRSQKPTYFKEIDSLINDDIMRWNFKFPKRYIEPTRFDIVYRVVLRKKQSDEEIIKQVQNRIKEEG